MFRIGAKQTKSMMNQFLLSAALTLTALVVALLMVVRYTTRGLSSLASAAKEIAAGNLQARTRRHRRWRGPFPFLGICQHAGKFAQQHGADRAVGIS